MDKRPIGVFDSGLGGLTAVKELIKVLPNEDIIYFGDTGRVPYGGRSRETIVKYARQDVNFLLRHDIKAIVVACGTVSTAALDVIKGDYGLPIYGVVEPAAAQAARLTKNRKIGLIGTRATVGSGAFERKLREYLPGAQVVSRACPLFVPLVENGRFQKGDVVIETVAAEYLVPVRDRGIDTLLMGCTHYPLLEDVIAELLGPAVRLVNAGQATAAFVARELGEKGLLSDSESGGARSYYVSDSTESFGEMASVFLREDVTGTVERVDIDGISSI